MLATLAASFVHPAVAPQPGDLWGAWSWDPAVLAGIALAAGLYLRGLRALWRRAGAGHGARPWQTAAYAGGLVTLFVALVSPLDALGAALFSAHMVQHMLLILVAAPLLTLGAPLLPLLWALPRRSRRRLGRWWLRSRVARPLWRLLTLPAVVWTLHALALWLWHLPSLYQAALRVDGIHALEHLSFLGTALLFWWPVVQRQGRPRLGYGAAVLYLFTMAVQGSLLGILLTFARAPWYPAYADTTAPWGLTPLEDQQLAGLVMWIPAGTIYLVAILALFAAWLRESDQSDEAELMAEPRG